LGYGTCVAEGGFGNGGYVFIPKAEDFSSCASVFFVLEGALIKEPDKGGAVVFADRISNSSGKAMVSGQGQTLFHVGQNNETTHGGGEVSVRIGIAGVEVFGEVFSFLDFSNVVVQGHGTAGAGVCGVGGGSGSFGKVSDQDAVEVGSRSFDGKLAEKGMIEASEFKPGEIGCAVEHGLEDREQGANKDRTEKTKSGRG